MSVSVKSTIDYHFLLGDSFISCRLGTAGQAIASIHWSPWLDEAVLRRKEDRSNAIPLIELKCNLTPSYRGTIPPRIMRLPGHDVINRTKIQAQLQHPFAHLKLKLLRKEKRWRAWCKEYLAWLLRIAKLCRCTRYSQSSALICAIRVYALVNLFFFKQKTRNYALCRGSRILVIYNHGLPCYFRSHND